MTLDLSWQSSSQAQWYAQEGEKQFYFCLDYFVPGDGEATKLEVIASMERAIKVQPYLLGGSTSSINTRRVVSGWSGEAWGMLRSKNGDI
jgi:hypothetical protein